MAEAAPRSLNILHVLRAPVGGLFRHVVDLARGQTARGHRVGLIADATSGGAQADATLADLSRVLALGLTRVPMSRQIGAATFLALAHVSRRAAGVAADVVHGHGAKGGAYARLARNARAIRVYTPHGGSLHYRWSTPAGFLYLAAERALMRRARPVPVRERLRPRCLPGESRRAERAGARRAQRRDGRRVRAGHDRSAATDLVFVGELRMLKGVDVLIKAIALLAHDGRAVTATIVGEGPDRAAFEAQVARHGLGGAVHFIGGHASARRHSPLGRLLVVPSRAESLPYVVLEAAAAGKPLIATRVGGIPEIFGPTGEYSGTPSDPAALAQAISAAPASTADATAELARQLRGQVRAAFSADTMTDAVLAAYRDGARAGGWLNRSRLRLICASPKPFLKLFRNTRDAPFTAARGLGGRVGVDRNHDRYRRQPIR